MTGLNPREYTEARRKLDLLPAQALWLTRPSNLTNARQPKVYRFGAWKTLTKVNEIQAALATLEAEIIDL